MNDNSVAQFYEFAQSSPKPTALARGGRLFCCLREPNLPGHDPDLPDSRIAGRVFFAPLECSNRPRGGMADTGDLKSPPGQLGCGFESHRGHSHRRALFRIRSQFAVSCVQTRTRHRGPHSARHRIRSHRPYRLFARLLLRLLLRAWEAFPAWVPSQRQLRTVDPEADGRKYPSSTRSWNGA